MDYHQVEILASMQCTSREISAVLGVQWTAATCDPLFAEAFEVGRAKGHESLRRAQWRAAVEEGNVTMLIWLGKQYLGQSDKVAAMALPVGPAGGAKEVVEIYFGDNNVRRN